MKSRHSRRIVPISLSQYAGLRCSDRRSQEFQTQILYGLIHFFGEDAVPIMDQEAIAVMAWNGFSELLRRPLGCAVTLQ
jgi:hypothetical protein